MPLIVQDPSNTVDNANSYQSLETARGIAEQYYLDLPSDDALAEKALVEAFRLIESKESAMHGMRATETQNTAYPRTGVCLRGESMSEDAFPNDLLYAQVVAASYAGKGKDINGGIDDGLAIAGHSAGKLNQTYFNNGKTGKAFKIVEFENAMKPLLFTDSGNTFCVGRA